MTASEPCRSVNVRLVGNELVKDPCTRHSGHHDECVDKDGNAWTRLAEWIRQAEDTSAEGASTA